MKLGVENVLMTWKTKMQLTWQIAKNSARKIQIVLCGNIQVDKVEVFASMERLVLNAKSETRILGFWVPNEFFMVE